MDLDKFADGGLILGSSQLLLLSELPIKMRLDLKVIKIDTKIIISLLLPKPMTHSLA
jgi:hypothetical protein